MVGRPYLQIKILTCFIAAALLSYIFMHIKNVKVRYIYSFTAGISLQCFMYDYGVTHSLVMMLGAYVIMHTVHRQKQHIVIFVLIYVYQSAIHINIMMTSWGQWGAEITAFTMNLVCRLISLAM